MSSACSYTRANIIFLEHFICRCFALFCCTFTWNKTLLRCFIHSPLASGVFMRWLLEVYSLEIAFALQHDWRAFDRLLHCCRCMSVRMCDMHAGLFATLLCMCGCMCVRAEVYCWLINLLLYFILFPLYLTHNSCLVAEPLRALIEKVLLQQQKSSNFYWIYVAGRDLMARLEVYCCCSW